MKFFNTKMYWDSQRQVAPNEDEIQEAFGTYLQSLKRLRPGLSKGLYEWLLLNNDCVLQSINILVDAKAKWLTPVASKEVALDFLRENGESLRLIYRDVELFHVLKELWKPLVKDHWGSQEVAISELTKSRSLYSHSILLHSGMLIRIDAKKVGLRRLGKVAKRTKVRR